MSIEDNDNIYILEEEEIEQDPDDSPRNFAAYKDEEREEEAELEDKKKGYSAFGILFRVMFNPVEGWKKLRRNKIPVEKMQAGCFYPLLAILALSKFASFFYSVNVNLSEVLTSSIVAFVSYFFTYLCLPMLVNLLLKKDISERYENRFGKEYTLVALSTLSLFSIITNLLPMIWPILIFLPLWTIYIMFKGVRFFKLPIKDEMKFFVTLTAGVIGLPLLIEWVLNTIMPY